MTVERKDLEEIPKEIQEYTKRFNAIDFWNNTNNWCDSKNNSFKLPEHKRIENAEIFNCAMRQSFNYTTNHHEEDDNFSCKESNITVPDDTIPDQQEGNDDDTPSSRCVYPSPPTYQGQDQVNERNTYYKTRSLGRRKLISSVNKSSSIFNDLFSEQQTD